jgi:oligopeptidase A
VPADVVQPRAAAEAEGKEGYKLTLKMPCYLPVMQFAKSSALRETSTAPMCAPPAWATALRQHAADREILACAGRSPAAGLPNFGEVSLVPKMAESPAR